MQHAAIARAEDVHECKQILTSSASDIGKVITPSGPGKGVLRRLSHTDLTGVASEEDVRTRPVTLDSTDVHQLSNVPRTTIFVTTPGARLEIGSSVSTGVIVDVVKMTEDASLSVESSRQFINGSKMSISSDDPLRSVLRVVVVSSTTLAGY